MEFNYETDQVDLTAWSGVLFAKLIRIQQIKKFPAFMKTGLLLPFSKERASL
jgi:hypothetical protein